MGTHQDHSGQHPLEHASAQVSIFLRSESSKVADRRSFFTRAGTGRSLGVDTMSNHRMDKLDSTLSSAQRQGREFGRRFHAKDPVPENEENEIRAYCPTRTAGDSVG